MKTHLNSSHTKAAQGYAFEIGEHVFVHGHDGEFVIVSIDRNAQTLQLLPVRSIGRIENVPAASVRIVMPPAESKHEKEAKTDGFGDPTAA